MSQQLVTLPFTPRRWQVPLLECQKPSIVAVVHRRAGKSTAFVWRALRKALTHQRLHIPAEKRNLRADPPRVVHVLPAQVMWQRTGLWDKVERAAELIPGAIAKRSVFRVELPNGGIYQCGGMDKPDSWRGGYSDEVIEDEADDVIASGLDMVVEPMLSDYSGTRVKVGTPKGNGRLAAAYDNAAHDENAARFFLRWQDTGVLDLAQIERLRANLDPEEFSQEMECSFTAPNSGSYYGKWIDDAIRDDRITKVTYDPKLPTYTAFDLGMDDYTSIWWFQRSPGGEWRWLEYFEDNRQSLDYYAKLIREKPYAYGKHFLPHDVEVQEMGTGQSRRATLLGLGVKPIKTVPAANPADRVSAVRMILPRSFFDAKGCEVGIKRLRAYRRQWNEHMGVWRSEPVHDEASHCFTGDTKVLTRYGTCRIMDLPNTGEVLTECGWNAYRNPRVTRISAPLVEVRFVDGYTARCTPDHLFMTDSGWKSARSLMKHTLVHCSLIQLPNTSRGIFISSIAARSIGLAARAGFTAICGLQPLVQFLKDATYTIATIVRRTMTLLTWSAFPQASICLMLGTLPRAAVNKTKRATSLPAPGRQQQHGTHRQKAVYGIADTQQKRRDGISESASRRFVRGVRRTLWASLRVLTQVNTAASPVRWLTIDSVESLNQRADVWCLTVPGSASFSLENGALVHNCADAIGTGVQGSTDPDREGERPRVREFVNVDTGMGLLG